MPTLKSVQDYLNGKRTQYRKPSMASVAKDFVNGPLREDIEAAFEEVKRSDKRLYVNTQVPTEAYTDMTEFVNECNKLIKPLGYDGSASHDGGGMYGTLYV